LLPLLSIQCMSRRDLSVKGGTSERCYRTRRGRTDEQRYAIISLYFDGRIQMNGPYPEITNISFLAKLFFKTFISLKHLSDYRTVGPADYRTVGLSDCRIIATAPSYYSSTHFCPLDFSEMPWSNFMKPCRNIICHVKLCCEGLIFSKWLPLPWKRPKC
jgi:hypothetical protein